MKDNSWMGVFPQPELIKLDEVVNDCIGIRLFTEEEGYKTCHRWLSAIGEMTAGTYETAEEYLRTFPSSNDQMVVQTGIEVMSVCQHHLLPFFGTCMVGYIPDGQVIGASKISRVVNVFARRLQLQENLTEQIADCLFNGIKPLGLGVLINARHTCMMARGVRETEAAMITTSLRGVFQEQHVKQEFLSYRGQP